MAAPVEHLPTIAIALALAWASGMRLYAVLFALGLAGYVQWPGWALPSSMSLLAHPVVLTSTGLLLVTEFFADKIPGLDTLWDAIHTFIRIPGGALLAAGIIASEDGAAWALAAGLLGGTITAGTHFLKAGGRAAINTSPEPLSNWTASFGEEALVVAGLWLAYQYPVVFLAGLVLFMLVVAWMLPKLWRLGIRMMRFLFARTANAPAA